MVADAALWALLAAAIGFLTYGCRMTRRAPTPIEAPVYEELDRAA
ncbi:MAG TPA: hypothetical protein VMF12_19665 [Xanthobacteraceae bacterium]|nr:hypothetical protein [Xanthobacteraceae bacterium]